MRSVAREELAEVLYDKGEGVARVRVLFRACGTQGGAGTAALIHCSAATHRTLRSAACSRVW